MIDVGFSIDLHDKDGEKWDDCLLLHFNDTFLLRLSGTKELDHMIKQLEKVKKEFSETFPTK